ncbi:MAG: hypothetical protein LQ342_002079 [Letrouitia transgressa]|nr:MAG: hypothetical protein LQ342_002079 [Letrouitia transgressa]
MRARDLLGVTGLDQALSAPNFNGYGVNGNPFIANAYPMGANPYPSCGVYGYPPSTAMLPMGTFPAPHAPAFSSYGMQTGHNIDLAPGQRSNISAGTWAEHATLAPHQIGAGATAFHTGNPFGNLGQHHNSFPFGEPAQNHGLPFGGYGQNGIGVSHGLHEQNRQKYDGILPGGYRQHHHDVLPGEYGQQHDRIPSKNYGHYRNNTSFGTFVPHNTGVSYGEYGPSSTGLPPGAYAQPPQDVNGFSDETNVPYPNALAPMFAASNPSIPSEDMLADFSGYSPSLNDDLRSPGCPCGPKEGHDASEQQESPQSDSRPQSDLADATSDSIDTLVSPASQPNSTIELSPCACGPGCQCAFCGKHPYNENSLNRAQDLRQLWEESSTSNNHPQSSYGDNIATSLPRDGSANALEDSQLANGTFSPDPLQRYNVVEYAFGENGIPKCPRGTETCRCIESCACRGCICHIGHSDELSRDE